MRKISTTIYLDQVTLTLMRKLKKLNNIPMATQIRIALESYLEKNQEALKTIREEENANQENTQTKSIA